MTTTAQPLLQTDHVPNTETTVLAAAARTLIDSVTAYNGDAAVQTLTVKLVPASGTASGQHVMVKKVLQPDETWTGQGIVGQYLAAGDFVSVVASAASAITLRISGRVVS